MAGVGTPQLALMRRKRAVCLSESLGCGDGLDGPGVEPRGVYFTPKELAHISPEKGSQGVWGQPCISAPVKE